MNVYTSSKLRYPLSMKEYDSIDRVWNYLSNFSMTYQHPSDYRKHIINSMNKYTIDELYTYETIANKLLWNLRWKTFKQFNNNMLSAAGVEIMDMCADNINKIKCMKSYMRSFVNKTIVIDGDKIYWKLPEGSSVILNSNDFNLRTGIVFLSRNLYENVMNNPKKILNVETPETYYQVDYAFPNINLCIFCNISRSKIRRFYFAKDEKYWFKLLK